MERRACGIDISHFQKAYDPQPQHDFVIIKCSDGVQKNMLYDQHYQACFESDKLVGAYHYLRSGIDWQDQRDAFLDYSRGAHFLAVDFEKKDNVFSITFANAALHLTDGLVNAHKSRKRVLFYSSPAVIQEWLFQQGQVWLRDYADLWIAQWPFRGWNSSLEKVPLVDGGWQPRLPAGCSLWRMWQYAADGNLQGGVNGVLSRDVDLDVFNGTVEDMKAWAGLAAYVEPEKKSWNEWLDEFKCRLDELRETE